MAKKQGRGRPAVIGDELIKRGNRLIWRMVHAPESNPGLNAKEIARRLDLPRPTFYRYFTDEIKRQKSSYINESQA